MAYNIILLLLLIFLNQNINNGPWTSESNKKITVRIHFISTLPRVHKRVRAITKIYNIYLINFFFTSINGKTYYLLG